MVRPTTIKSGLLCLLPALLAVNESAHAIAVNDQLDIGGSIRVRFDYDPDEDLKKLSVDTLTADVNYTSDSWIGSAQYRVYGGSYPYDYVDSIGDIAYIPWAWIGYKFTPEQQVQAGIHQVPFGLLPYFGNTYYEGLGNVIGLEEMYNLGVKYIRDTPEWNLQAAFYPDDGGQGKGTSRGGKSYSINVALADDYVEDGSSNDETDKFVLRLTRKLQLGNWTSELGGSLMTSTLENKDTGRDGRRNAAALHYLGSNGPWGLQLQYAHQDLDPKNAGTDKLVTFGSYDGTFNVAAKGDLWVGELAYDVPGTYGPISYTKLYGNYSYFDKSESDFKDSHRFILGSSFYFKELWVAAEWIFGKNDPYIGGSSYTQSAGAGGTDQWENQLYINIGYYF